MSRVTYAEERTPLRFTVQEWDGTQYASRQAMEQGVLEYIINELEAHPVTITDQFGREWQIELMVKINLRRDPDDPDEGGSGSHLGRGY